jgi:hypothetical protein
MFCTLLAMLAGTVLQFGCPDLPTVPSTARSKVTAVAAADRYSLAWQGGTTNMLLGWGNPVYSQLLGSLDGRIVTNVAGMSGSHSHALVLLGNGSVVGGSVYGPDDSIAKGPVAGALKGRLVRVAAGYFYSLGIDSVE